MLNKRELEAYLRECGMDDQGTVEGLRRRLSTYINGGYYDAEQVERFLELEARHSSATTRASPTPQVIPSRTGITIDDRTFDRVRAWNLKFRPGDDPLEFLERVEELTTYQRVPIDHIPYTLYEVFTGEALTWWRNRRTEWTDWVSFRSTFLRYFLPSDYKLQLEEQIRKRTQGRNESFKHFALELESLLRKANHTSEQRLDRIYQNCLPSIRIHIPRRQFTTLDELTERVGHIENCQQDMIHSREPPRRPNASPTRHRPSAFVPHNLRIPPPFIPTSARIPLHIQPTGANGYPAPPLPAQPQVQLQPPPPAQPPVSDPQTACRRCGTQGHTQNQCQSEQLLFCWECGRRNVRTRECCRPQARSRRTQTGRKTRVSTNINSNSGEEVRIGALEHDDHETSALLHIGPITRRAILDTGSWYNFITPKVAAELAPYGQQREETTRITMAGGQQTNTTSAVDVLIHWNNNAFPTKFLVLPTASDDVIIGWNLMYQMGLRLVELKSTTISPSTGHPHEDKPEDGSQTQRGDTISNESRGAIKETPRPREHPSIPTPSQVRQTPPIPRPRTRQNPVPSPRLRTTTTTKNMAPPEQMEEAWDTREDVQTFLAQELAMFEGIEGLTPIATHKITMKDEVPIKHRYQPRNPKMLKIIHEKVDELLAAGRIEPSNSAYSAPVVLTPKKTGEMRMCIDYRQLNAHSIPDAYPLPRIQSNLSRLRNATVISSLDLKDGYWQIPIEPESRKYTAFTVHEKGLFQWKVMPFGLHSAPATFQRELY